MIRTRQSTGELCMPFDAFKAADFGQLCTFLGLAPTGVKVVGMAPEEPRKRSRRRRRP